MATIRDVANAAGVSPATVSRILNNDTSLSTSMDTKERVIKAARDLKYTKKKSQTVQSNCTIGILQWFSSHQEIQDNYYLLIRQGIEDYCASHKINIVRTFKSDLNYLASLSNTDGIVCIGKFSSSEIDTLKSITKNIVFLDMTIPDSLTTTISLDFNQAIIEVLTYLKNIGHKKIGFLGGKEFLEDGSLFEDQRKISFISYCENNKISYKEFIMEDTFSVDSGYNMMKQIIKNNKIPTAIFAASDSIAIGAMKALQDNGFSIPEDVSIVGFNNTAISKYTTPPLTTISAPAYAMGVYGASILKEMTISKLPAPLKIQLPCALIQRSTCKSL